MNQQQIIEQQIIVVGGGMIGAAAALGLAKLGLKVALLEKQPLPEFVPDSPYDVRISAISVASVALLEKLGAWQAIEAMRVWAYDGLETWEIDGFNTAFHARELGLDKLGFMVENRVIQVGLWQALQGYENCTQAVGFDTLSADYQQGQWTLTFDNHQQFSAPIVLACDGANSVVRRWSGIGLTSWQYRQHCLLAVVKMQGGDLPTNTAELTPLTSSLTTPLTTTWQQFFPSGPRAFLPLQGDNGCVVWYDSPERIRQLQQLSPEKLAEEIHRHFPSRLGRVEVVSAGSFPLTRQHAQQYVRQGVVLVGDSAHTINPLAGQGVNLGFKDVAALLEVIEQAVSKGENVADEQVLTRYEKKRKTDNAIMQAGMDVFYKTFKTDLLPVKVVRNLALVMAQRATFLKKRALKYALGL